MTSDQMKELLLDNAKILVTDSYRAPATEITGEVEKTSEEREDD